MATAQDGGKVVSLTHRPLFTPQETLPVLISVRGWVDPRVIVRSEGFYVNKKNLLTPAGIEPATFRFVAQHLNHCATAVPIYRKLYWKYICVTHISVNTVSWWSRRLDFINVWMLAPPPPPPPLPWKIRAIVSLHRSTPILPHPLCDANFPL